MNEISEGSLGKPGLHTWLVEGYLGKIFSWKTIDFKQGVRMERPGL